MGINRDVQNVDEYWEEITQRNGDGRLSGLDGVDMANSIQIEYATTALRNAATNQEWKKGDQSFITGDTVYFYIGDNLDAGAITTDADWASGGGGGSDSTITLNGRDGIAEIGSLEVTTLAYSATDLTC